MQISFLGAHGQLSLGVALLFAAVLGILLVVIPGTARIVQLPDRCPRHRAIDAAEPDSTEMPSKGTSPAPDGAGST